MENIEFLNELQVAAEKLINYYELLVMITLFLRWVAFFTAIFLMILDRTKWKYSNNILTSVLAPYLFASLPSVIFQFLRTGFGKWISLLTVVLRLFLPNHFPESLEIPGATILLIVASPNFFVEFFRIDLRNTGCILCLYTSLYLLSKHTEACGGYKNSFTQTDRISYTICLYILFVFPIWFLFASIFI